VTVSESRNSIKSGIIRDDEGYDILVHGQKRTFRDLKEAAYDAALVLKTTSMGQDKIEIVDRATGQRVEMLEGGRTR
jgi:hypothetical protein